MVQCRFCENASLQRRWQVTSSEMKSMKLLQRIGGPLSMSMICFSQESIVKFRYCMCGVLLALFGKELVWCGRLRPHEVMKRLYESSPKVLKFLTHACKNGIEDQYKKRFERKCANTFFYCRDLYFLPHIMKFKGSWKNITTQQFAYCFNIDV